MKPPFAYYGGKQRISGNIIPMIPKHTVYVEPFCGGATVLFRKPFPCGVDASTYREVINDLNSHVINFFKVLRDDGQELCRRLDLSLYSQELCRQAKDLESGTDLERAEKFFINISQSFGMKLNGGWGTGVYNTNHPILYMHKVKNLINYIERMKSVYISSGDALRVIERFDSPQTFFYCDPPYPETHQGHYNGYSIDDFMQLVEVLQNIKGSFLLSCYPLENIPFEYKDFVASSSICNTGDGKGKERTERVYYKYTKEKQKKDIQKLFDSGKFDCFTGGHNQRQTTLF